MSRSSLAQVAVTVLRRAEQQEYVLAREIREELALAGLDEKLWKNVVTLIRPSVRYRKGRYYFESSITTRMQSQMRQQQNQQRSIQNAVRQLIRVYKSEAVRSERRQHRRIQFVQTVTALTEDRRELHLLTRDISLLGIRLIGTCSLLGQKIRMWIPQADDATKLRGLLVHILWSNAVADGLYENGGIFLGLLEQGPDSLKIVGVKD